MASETTCRTAFLGCMPAKTASAATAAEVKVTPLGGQKGDARAWRCCGCHRHEMPA